MRGAPRLGLTLLVALATVRSAVPCGAADAADVGAATATDEHKRWAFELATPIWIPGNYGTVTVHDHTAHVDTSPGDTIDLMTSGHAFAGEGYFDFRYDRFFAFADVLGGYFDESVSENVPVKQFPRLGGVAVDAKMKLKQVMGDFALGYRLGAWAVPNRRRPITLGVYAGTRYYWFDTRIRAAASLDAGRRGLHRAADVSETFEWADPMIGVRFEVPLLDCVSLDFRSDVGGFDAGSDIAWNVVGNFKYWVPTTLFSGRPFVAAGYRAVGFERSEGSGDEIDLQFRGPVGTLGVLF